MRTFIAGKHSRAPHKPVVDGEPKGTYLKYVVTCEDTDGHVLYLKALKSDHRPFLLVEDLSKSTQYYVEAKAEKALPWAQHWYEVKNNPHTNWKVLMLPRSEATGRGHPSHNFAALRKLVAEQDAKRKY